MEDSASFASFPYLIGNKKIIYFAFISDNYHRTFTTFSGGKIFGVTGTRFGYGIGSKENIDLVQQTLLRNYTMASPFEQIVFAKNFDSATQPYENCDSYWDFVKKDTEMRYNHLSNILVKHNLQTLSTDGTNY